ncbi:hypothetical protein CEP54_008943 [Fusarium duplospermum]|uniref:Uncharacterized protein n=1 Tax=Fusarium duplospermum TaxID=1325734 RepID=A0A428PTC5_9HYPO|nr:hypothetical protein CEP54_008943 [Fusarium duplospermum]
MARRLVRSLFLAEALNSLGAFAAVCIPSGPTAYCQVTQWKNNPLIVIFNAHKEYAEGVCTSALQPVTTVSGTNSASTETVVVTITQTDNEVVTETEYYGGGTETVSAEPSTVYVTASDEVVTETVRNSDSIVVDAETVQRTVGTTTLVAPASIRTIEKTEVDHVGSTRIRTVTIEVETQTSVEYTATEYVTTSTSVDVVTETSTSVETILTTTTDYVTTGTYVKFAPGATLVVTESRTFVIHSVPSTRTHTQYTSTDVVTVPTSTLTIESTDTTSTTVTTTTFEVSTATGTSFKTVYTSTETDVSTSTASTNDWTTEYFSTYTNTRTVTTVDYTEHVFPWWKKRSLPTPGLDARGESSPEQGWLDQFGETHFRSACSCIVTFPLSTRTVYEDVSGSAAVETRTDYTTVAGQSTAVGTVHRETVTVTVANVVTVTQGKTSTHTVVVDGTTSFGKQTVTEDVLATVYSTPVDETTVTYFTTNSYVTDVTDEVSVTDHITLQGIKTGYTWVEITRTEQLLDIQTKIHPVGHTIEVEATSTSLFTLTVETTVDVTSTALSTADETVNAVLTQTKPVLVTDINKFTYTATIFTDATTTVSLEATSTIGIISTTKVTIVTTVKNGQTLTYTSTVGIESTVTARAAATQTCGIPISDGRMNLSKEDSPWHESVTSWYHYFKRKLNNDPAHGWVMETEKLYDNYEIRLWQDARSCKGVRFSCTFEYYWDKYYEVELYDSDGELGTYVPYFRMWWNDDKIGEDWPVRVSNTGRWWTGTIEFTATGRWDTLWIYAASPQSKSTGDNFMRFDNFVCRPIQYNPHRD